MFHRCLINKNHVLDVFTLIWKCANFCDPWVGENIWKQTGNFSGECFSCGEIGLQISLWIILAICLKLLLNAFVQRKNSWVFPLKFRTNLQNAKIYAVNNFEKLWVVVVRIKGGKSLCFTFLQGGGKS